MNTWGNNMPADDEITFERIKELATDRDLITIEKKAAKELIGVNELNEIFLIIKNEGFNAASEILICDGDADPRWALDFEERREHYYISTLRPGAKHEVKFLVIIKPEAIFTENIVLKPAEISWNDVFEKTHKKTSNEVALTIDVPREELLINIGTAIEIKDFKKAILLTEIILKKALEKKFEVKGPLKYLLESASNAGIKLPFEDAIQKISQLIDMVTDNLYLPSQKECMATLTIITEFLKELDQLEVDDDKRQQMSRHIASFIK